MSVYPVLCNVHGTTFYTPPVIWCIHKHGHVHVYTDIQVQENVKPVCIQSYQNPMIWGFGGMYCTVLHSIRDSWDLGLWFYTQPSIRRIRKNRHAQRYCTCTCNTGWSDSLGWEDLGMACICKFTNRPQLISTIENIFSCLSISSAQNLHFSLHF